MSEPRSAPRNVETVESRNKEKEVSKKWISVFILLQVGSFYDPNPITFQLGQGSLSG